MAFTRKPSKFSGSAKKAAPKAAASYARKKRQEEEIEVEEVDEVEAEGEAEPEQEEVQDDYDEQEAQEAPAPRRGFTRPAAPARQAQAPRQFSNSGGHGGNGEQKKALRLTGLFAGKREGCFSGKLRTEDAENLAALIEEANSTNQQIVFFLWENQGNPQFSLTANISAPKQFGNGGGNRGRGGWQGNNGGNSGGFRKRW